MKVQAGVSREAFVRTLTGIVFGLIVAVAVTIASMWEWRPVKLIQSWGSDAGLRVLADPFFARNGGDLTTDAPFLFIDLDVTACAAFVGDTRTPTDCDSPASPPPDLIAALIEGIDRTGAIAVVLDYRLPNPGKVVRPDVHARLGRLKDLLTAPEGVPVIAPAPLAPDARVATALDRENDRFVDDWIEGRLRLAAFMTWADPDVRDGVVRGYPAIVDVRRVSEDTTLHYLPSAPFLAALIAEGEEGLTAADALFYSNGDESRCSSLRTGPQSVVGRSAPYLAEHCNDLQNIPADSKFLRTQIFSVYSLSVPFAYRNGRSFDDQRLRTLARTYYGSGTVEGGMLYRRYSLKDFIGEDGTVDRLFRDVNFEGQIVVVGTSSFEAGDWHHSSLGALTGSELIINAARAFADFAPLSDEKSFWNKLWQKFQLVLISGFTLFFFTYISVAVSRRITTSGVMSFTKWWHFPVAPLAALPGPAIFLVGVFAAMVAVSFWIYRKLDHGASLASFDFFLPVLSVAFEGIVEICHGMLNRIHHAIETVVASIKDKLGAG